MRSVKLEYGDNLWVVARHLSCSLGKGAPSLEEYLPVTLLSSSNNHRHGWKRQVELDVVRHVLQLATCFLLSCPITFSYPGVKWNCICKYQVVLKESFSLVSCRWVQLKPASLNICLNFGICLSNVDSKAMNYISMKRFASANERRPN